MIVRLTPRQKRAQQKRDAWNEAQRPFLKAREDVEVTKARAERVMNAHDKVLTKKLGLDE